MLLQDSQEGAGSIAVPLARIAESIERAVSVTSERSNLFDLLSAAMPTAMRHRLDGTERRRTLAEVAMSVDAAKNAALRRRVERRRELIAQIASYIPQELKLILYQQADLLDPPDPLAAHDNNITPAASQLEPPRTTDNRPLTSDL